MLGFHDPQYIYTVASPFYLFFQPFLNVSLFLPSVSTFYLHSSTIYNLSNIVKQVYVACILLYLYAPYKVISYSYILTSCVVFFHFIYSFFHSILESFNTREEESSLIYHVSSLISPAYGTDIIEGHSSCYEYMIYLSWCILKISCLCQNIDSMRNI